MSLPIPLQYWPMFGFVRLRVDSLIKANQSTKGPMKFLLLVSSFTVCGVL